MITIEKIISDLSDENLKDIVYEYEQYEKSGFVSDGILSEYIKQFKSEEINKNVPNSFVLLLLSFYASKKLAKKYILLTRGANDS